MRKSLFFAWFSILLLCGIAHAALVDNSDGTVTDTATGLMWQQETAGSRTWEAALSYCENLSLAGLFGLAASNHQGIGIDCRLWQSSHCDRHELFPQYSVVRILVVYYQRGH